MLTSKKKLAIFQGTGADGTLKKVNKAIQENNWNVVDYKLSFAKFGHLSDAFYAIGVVYEEQVEEYNLSTNNNKKDGESSRWTIFKKKDVKEGSN